ncbi:hypothetical protein FNV43_RR07308 [Rhamnella rubrinervis]|uniref:RNase H type-1 domain-containing protein n=1 Tax=Rhamnella rubrinervis TaxID=2594499 RepID=A0A8K0HG97_9ROSA|nr:hypothetical protein FNV43_RR07308 [Rhamnella rubrinervis]
MVSDNIKAREMPSSGSSDSQGWCPPQQGFLKVNVDAAFLDGRATAAMVVRNDQGHLLYLASKLYECVSPFAAEVEALGWAMEYANQCGWRRVGWETDAKEVERAVNAREDPSCWYSYYSMCNIRKCIAMQDWKVIWRSRRCNSVADAAAKLSLSTERPFVFDEFTFKNTDNCLDYSNVGLDEVLTSSQNYDSLQIILLTFVKFPTSTHVQNVFHNFEL